MTFGDGEIPSKSTAHFTFQFFQTAAAQWAGTPSTRQGCSKPHPA